MDEDSPKNTTFCIWYFVPLPHLFYKGFSGYTRRFLAAQKRMMRKIKKINKKQTYILIRSVYHSLPGTSPARIILTMRRRKEEKMIKEVISLVIPLFGAPFMLGLSNKIIKKKKKDYFDKGRVLETHMNDTQKMIMTAGSAAAFLLSGIFVAWMTKDVLMTALCTIMYTCCAMVMQIDADIRIIPNEILLIILLDAIAKKMIEVIQTQSGWNLLYSAIAMIIVFEVDKVVNTISRLFGAQAISMGDIKLMSLLTFFYWGNMNQMIGWLTGFVVAVFGILLPMLLARKISRFSFFAFGSYIATGVAGEAILAFARFVIG
ncbi:hypothetical protein [Bilifractor sp. HCP3S3_D3]|uniref:hypothetical protein n=1 Tax=Bilifractor sp. HCP3S3_D3 TaxID=3438907 RepID=UPI003F8B48BC